MMKESKILVPAQKNTGEKINEFFILDLKRDLAKEYGGFTIQEVLGGYIMQEGYLKEEKMIQITLSFNPEDMTKNAYLLDIARKVKNVMEQEAVYVNLNGAVYFI